MPPPNKWIEQIAESVNARILKRRQKPAVDIGPWTNNLARDIAEVVNAVREEANDNAAQYLRVCAVYAQTEHIGDILRSAADDIQTGRHVLRLKQEGGNAR